MVDRVAHRHRGRNRRANQLHRDVVERGRVGWGINVNHQGERLFVTLFTYGSDGRDLWIVGSELVRQGDGAFSGEIHRVTGPAFNASPWTAINATSVGTMTLRFSAPDRGTLSYTFNGTPVSKTIERYVFGPPPACTSVAGSRAAQTNYQDMWWNPAESGWGVNLTHQGDILFATLFTYAPTAATCGSWARSSRASPTAASPAQSTASAARLSTQSRGRPSRRLKSAR
jgi:hypothetical protein